MQSLKCYLLQATILSVSFVVTGIGKQVEVVGSYRSQFIENSDELKFTLF